LELLLRKLEHEVSGKVRNVATSRLIESLGWYVIQLDQVPIKQDPDMKVEPRTLGESPMKWER
jgi:hypothetical protein